MWTERFMSGQTGQQHVTAARGLDGAGRGGLCVCVLRRLPHCVMCGFMERLVCRYALWLREPSHYGWMLSAAERYKAWQTR